MCPGNTILSILQLREEVWRVFIKALRPLSEVHPEIPSLQSVTEALECQMALSDVEVLDEEAFFPLGSLEDPSRLYLWACQHDFQDPAVLN